MSLLCGRDRRFGDGHGRRRRGARELWRLEHQRRRRRGRCARDPDAFFAFLDFKFCDSGRFDKVDQRLQLAQIHGGTRATEAASLPLMDELVQQIAGFTRRSGT